MTLHLRPQSTVGNSGRWKPGQSGNPKGAPKRIDSSLTELCRAHTTEAVKTLVTIMRFKGPNQLPAAIAILDRGWGRPKQQIETTGNATIELHLTAARLVSQQMLLEGSAESDDLEAVLGPARIIDQSATPTE